MWKLTLDADEEQHDYLLEGTEGLCSLSPMQSLIVFAKPIKFALLFTFGNVMAVGSTALLIGPTQQLRMMFNPVRVYATAIYIGFVVVALICALLIHGKLLTVIAIICEIGALIWNKIRRSFPSSSGGILNAVVTALHRSPEYRWSFKGTLSSKMLHHHSLESKYLLDRGQFE